MTTKLLRAGQVSYERTRAAAKEIDVWLSARRSAWLEKEFSNEQVRRIRKSIAQQGANGRLNDYSAAEQAFLAIESLSIHIDDFDEVEGVLDRLYEAVEVEKTFSPAKFRAASRAAAGRL